MTSENSKKWKLNKADLIKLSKSFALSLTGIVLDLIAEYLLKIDFGQFTPMVYAFTPVAANLLRKFLAGKN